MPFVIIDLGPDNVRRAVADGHRAYFGDVTSPEVLEHLALERALELVIAVNDREASARAIRAARRAAPGLRILARSPYDADCEGLRRHGADRVVSAESAAARELTAAVLAECRDGGDREGVE